MSIPHIIHSHYTSYAQSRTFPREAPLLSSTAPRKSELGVDAAGAATLAGEGRRFFFCISLMAYN